MMMDTSGKGEGAIMKRGRAHDRAAGSTLVANLHTPVPGRWAALAVLALVMVALPSGARAAHWGDIATCYECHTLSPASEDLGGAVPDTKWINPVARTISEIKAAWAAAGKPNTKNVPDNFGCTYCHSDSTRTGTMLDALSHFKTDVTN